VDVAQTIAERVSQVWASLSSVSILWALLALIFAIVVYFLPTLLAAVLHHPSGRVVLIGVLNLLFGWTGLGWFALLGWAMIGRPRERELAPSEDFEMVPFVHPPNTGSG
jgi:T4 superinfection immunity protein